MDKSENNATEMKAAELIKNLNTTDTFLFEFPKVNGLVDTDFMFIKLKYEKELQVPSLEKGFDSLQIRIWYGCALSGERLVALIHNGKIWKAEISDIKKVYYEDSETFGPLTRIIIKREPRSGWDKFIDTLFNLKILTLPDEKNIPGFESPRPMDGCGIGIEISTKNVYRCYGFENPDLKGDKHWQAKNVLLIIKLLSDEFKISEWPEYPKEKKLKRKVKSDTLMEIKLYDSIPTQ